MKPGIPFDAVLDGAQADEPWAYEQIWGRLAPKVVAYFRLKGAAEADDLTSEVFLAAFRSIRQFRGGEAAFSGWIFRIARCRLVDAYRRAAARPVVVDHPAVDGPAGSVEDDALAMMGVERVKMLCGKLPPAQREVLLLRVLADLTVEQVAGLLDRSPGAVKALQRRGLEHLRQLLAPASSEGGVTP